MWYKFFGKPKQFFEIGVNFVVKIGKNGNWFTSNLAVNFQRKMTICLRSLNMFVMSASLVKAKILQKCQF